MGALHFRQVNQEQGEWHVLGKISMDAHGTQHWLISGITDPDPQPSPQAKSPDAEDYEKEGEKRGVKWQSVHDDRRDRK